MRITVIALWTLLISLHGLKCIAEISPYRGSLPCAYSYCACLILFGYVPIEFASSKRIKKDKIGTREIQHGNLFNYYIDSPESAFPDFKLTNFFLPTFYCLPKFICNRQHKLHTRKLYLPFYVKLCNLHYETWITFHVLVMLLLYGHKLDVQAEKPISRCFLIPLI